MNHKTEYTFSTRQQLDVQHITVTLGQKKILDDISFSADSSHPLIGLVGPNGSGKTTLLKTICNLQKHLGSSKFNDCLIEKLSLKELSKQISYIPQRNGIQVSMSVFDVVLLGFNPQLSLLGHPSQAMKSAALNALDTVGILSMKDQDFLTLSEGEKQLCIFARTIVEKSSLLLLDEPDSALDFHNKYSMMSLIKDILQSHNCMAILCLHDPNLALEFCDQLIMIKDGNLIASVYPKSDPVSQINDAFSKLYHHVYIQEILDHGENRRLMLFHETGNSNLKE